MSGETGLDWRLIGAILFGLFCFGMAFNAMVDWLGDRQHGYTSLLVVGGVLVTLGGAAVIDWRAAVIVLACFVASGLPMVIGEIARTIRKREKALRLMELIAQERQRDEQA